jgi:hypothetical protein
VTCFDFGSGNDNGPAMSSEIFLPGPPLVQAEANPLFQKYLCTGVLRERYRPSSDLAPDITAPDIRPQGV